MNDPIELDQDNRRYPKNGAISLSNIEKVSFSDLRLNNATIQAHFVKLDFGEEQIANLSEDQSIVLDYPIDFKSLYFTIKLIDGEQGRASLICKPFNRRV
ncbi:hypothetical protein U0035_01845 [Niabella yanshanensis]|uniref:Uncharacterized protein n=1 Tax=Niabella yanshanensis TaxID=577386 RepID=A0ABZ0W6I7_9BACT|nr:hypothetical protein [Niabella yanshanensis]WQD38885.1 hypothetical protein U0035_01845 [Niabella yanshanensis]